LGYLSGALDAAPSPDERGRKHASLRKRGFSAFCGTRAGATLQSAMSFDAKRSAPGDLRLAKRCHAVPP
jgi:hypothetical protein